MRRGENFEEALKACFKNVPIDMVLKGEVSYARFSRELFRRIVLHYLDEYSDTELDSLYGWMCGKSGDGSGRVLNLFEVLIWSAKETLIQANGKILCKYSELLRWRNIASVLGEDLLICAYLADWSEKYHLEWTDFSWETTIPHNNLQLNRVLERGLSENHFHLYGSAPVALLMWKMYMGNVGRKEMLNALRKIDCQRRTANVHFETQYMEESFVVLHLKAALIRLRLMVYIAQKKRCFEGKWFEKEFSALWEESLLQEDEKIAQCRFQIQYALSAFREFLLPCIIKAEDDNKNAFAEERWFLYQMFFQYKKSFDKTEEEFRLFFAYLIIKINFSAEIVQNNSIIGFENFAILQKRKNVLFCLPSGEKELVRQAVSENLNSRNIKRLEIRITPPLGVTDAIREIRQLDYLIKDSQKSKEKHKLFFYVYHFTKIGDNAIGDGWGIVHCRNFSARQKAKKQAAMIVKLREYAPEEASRILGIDACSQEIGCRPEVFGSTYRKLRNHVCAYQDALKRIPQLRTTYHVGEEFLDMIDGLRAIEEAVRFLDFCCGDRLGHATVLGLSVGEWYRRKRNLIHISAQDYLDNVSWFYHKLVEFNIEGCEVLKDYLLREFEKYFFDIYRKNIDYEILHQAMQESKSGLSGLQFDIFTYYDAWKLRGDEPKLYKKGRYIESSAFDVDEFLLGNSFPENDKNRRRPETAFLYYMYHYDANVRKAGANELEVRIPDIYVSGVHKIQSEMQQYISCWGIAIETNPSSNLMISNMNNYKEHPIVNLYNKGLTWDLKKLQNCPQMFVSINTDDKGIFQTSLENEYSLLACDLEKERDKDGQHIYNRQMIYDWLDAIRKMGNQQSFWKPID